MGGVRDRRICADVLILGSGLAGLLLALELAEAGKSVIIAAKASLSESNTSLAQGGLAAALPGSGVDSVEQHLADTLKAGAGLTDGRVASLILREGAALVRRLRQLGVSFDVGLSGNLAVTREGGHTHARVVHRRDTTGEAISSALIERVSKHALVLALQNCFAVDLIVTDGSCVGATVLMGGRPETISAGAVVLATGGAGRLYERTTNPEVATADGIAMAFRAGARLIDMEFFQFHPTALYKPPAPAFLISEAVRGEGAVLLDQRGRRFATRFHPDGELATRDVVARGICTIMREEGIPSVWIDLRPIGATAVKNRFPGIVEECRRHGLDPLSEPVPVAPAAHYFMGGIETDEFGCTSIPGLYAVGECAATGLHGANRLASNSLLEAGVMAFRVAARIAESDSPPPQGEVGGASVAPLTIPASLPQLRRLMYEKVGLERDQKGLELFLSDSSLSFVRALPSERRIAEAANLLLVGRLMARAALERRESRGAHFRSDFPSVDDRMCRRFYQSTSGSGWVDIGTEAGIGKPNTAGEAVGINFFY